MPGFGAALTIAALVAFALGVALIAVFAMPIGRRLGLLDQPDGARKQHREVTPLVGGMALMLPLAAAALLLAMAAAAPEPIFLVLAIANLGFMLLGMFDDRRHISAPRRLAISFALGCAFVAIEPDLLVRAIDVPTYGWLVELGPLALPFTLVCLVGLQNAVNMADGKNGLVISLAAVWIVLLTPYAPGPLLPYLALFLVGLLILLPFNLAGRLFLGDAGSYSVGVTAGLLAIYVHGHSGGRLSSMMIMLWFLVPVLDCLRVIAQRLWERRSPFNGDRNHLHHRLLMRLGWPRSLLVYLALVVGPAVVSCLLPDAAPLLILFSAAAYGLVIWLTRIDRPVPVPREGAGQARRLLLQDRKA